MAEETIIHADLRGGRGKQVAKQLRRAGRLPAVVYGEEIPPVNCSVDRKQLEDILHAHGRNAILSLVMGNGDGEAQNTIIKDIQHHPVRRDILHVDFHRISLTERIVVEVPVEAVGIPNGVRTSGGILEQRLHQVEVECLPAEIPDQIAFDVVSMEIGDTIHVSDLVIGGNVQIVTEGDRSVFVVVPPSVVKTAEEEAEEAAEAEEKEMQEPEVIERGKRDEAEEEEEDER